MSGLVMLFQTYEAGAFIGLALLILPPALLCAGISCFVVHVPTWLAAAVGSLLTTLSTFFIAYLLG